MKLNEMNRTLEFVQLAGKSKKKHKSTARGIDFG